MKKKIFKFYESFDKTMQPIISEKERKEKLIKIRS